MLIRLYNYYKLILVSCDLVTGQLFLSTVMELCQWPFVSCLLTWAGWLFTHGLICHLPMFVIVCLFPAVGDRPFLIFPWANTTFALCWGYGFWGLQQVVLFCMWFWQSKRRATCVNSGQSHQITWVILYVCCCNFLYHNWGLFVLSCLDKDRCNTVWTPCSVVWQIILSAFSDDMPHFLVRTKWSSPDTFSVSICATGNNEVVPKLSNTVA